MAAFKWTAFLCSSEELDKTWTWISAQSEYFIKKFYLLMSHTFHEKPAHYFFVTHIYHDIKYTECKLLFSLCIYYVYYINLFLEYCKSLQQIWEKQKLGKVREFSNSFHNLTRDTWQKSRPRSVASYNKNATEEAATLCKDHKGAYLVASEIVFTTTFA